eukprot:TRINITY_DN64914_c0_g1_i1.p1 TRINITY_DN64914_c0_g1~~TRINITY_DN64914_c0_g1_i1.p1  ORF type:complete len:229 (-),score=33.97 TRINITY_DN64914_c0_g1_i1:309-995(-)
MGWDAGKPFLTRLAIQRWKARFPHWPPKDASPPTPIEPWGKQFFVYNAPFRAEFRGDPRAPPLDDIKPSWIRDVEAASMLREGETLNEMMNPLSRAGKTVVESSRAASAAANAQGAETLLCATDFRQRPLLYLNPNEWAEFVRQIPLLKERLRQRQAEVDALDERGAHMREDALRRMNVLDKFEHRMMGKEGYGVEQRRSYETGKIPPKTRERKIQLTTVAMGQDAGR